MREEILRLVSEAIDVDDISVQIDGNRALIEVRSAAFQGLSRVQSHQLVYGCIEHLIADGSLHAVTVRPSAASTDPE